MRAPKTLFYILSHKRVVQNVVEVVIPNVPLVGVVAQTNRVVKIRRKCEGVL